MTVQDYNKFAAAVRLAADANGVNLGTLSFSGPGVEGDPMAVDFRINKDQSAPSRSFTPHQKRVIDLLNNAREIYEERSAVYKDNYKAVGRVMEAMFPDGAPRLMAREDYDRWHIFELMIVKLTRYANNYEMPHEDSLDDLRVYSTILGALDREFYEEIEKQKIIEALDDIPEEDDSF